MIVQEKAPTLLLRLYRLQGDCERYILDPSKRVRAPISHYTHNLSIAANLIGKTYIALVSPKRCELSPDLWQTFKIKTNQTKIALRLALLIFKSGLNRIKLTVVRSGAATPKKMFLMLARLSEITNHINGLGQQQLLIDNYIRRK